MNNGASLAQTRAIVFTTLILSNVFLTFTNRSFVSTIYYTIRYKNKLAPLFYLFLRFSWPPCMIFLLCALFQLETITPGRFWLCFGIAFASVMWIERYNTGFLKLKNRQLVVPCPALSVVKQKQSSAVFQGSRE